MFVSAARNVSSAKIVPLVLLGSERLPHYCLEAKADCDALRTPVPALKGDSQTDSYRTPREGCRGCANDSAHISTRSSLQGVISCVELPCESTVR